jgi:PEP-CTERM motif
VWYGWCRPRVDQGRAYGMRIGIAMVCCAALGAIACQPAVAGPIYGTVYSEDFNNPGFQGTPLNLGVDSNSDRWVVTDYSLINNFDGWTFVNGDYLATNGADSSDSALLLNESSGSGTASTTLSDLNVGEGYVLTFLQWGDNRPGQAYVGTVSVGGGLVLTYTGVDQAPGTNPGVVQSVYFIATSTTETLAFGQDSSTQGSPIIDDILVTGVPEPGSLVLLGTGLLGLATLRRARTA